MEICVCVCAVRCHECDGNVSRFGLAGMVYVGRDVCVSVLLAPGLGKSDVCAIVFE